MGNDRTLPSISILMAVYNEETYLKDTIESILAQTFSDFEFIIVDDGSNDKTPQILNFYSNQDQRIKLIKNETNIGLYRSLNKGLNICFGEYIARIDAADIADASRLAKQVNFLNNNLDIHIVGTFAYYINEKKDIIGKAIRPIDKNLIKKKAYKGTPAIHPTMMIRRDLFQEIGPYSGNHIEDFELCLRALKHGFLISNIPEFLMYIGRRERGISYTHRKIIYKREFFLRFKNIHHFLNFWSIFYLILGFIAAFAPESLLKLVMDSIFRRGSTKI